MGHVTHSLPDVQTWSKQIILGITTGFDWVIISGVEDQRDAVSSVPGPSRLLKRIRKEMSSSLPS
jgi:hypothetical protein